MKTRLAVGFIVFAGLCSNIFAQTAADGFAHTARIEYDGINLVVYLDDMGTPLFEIRLNLNLVATLNEGRAWIGLTSATGGWHPDMEINYWSFWNGDANFYYPDFNSVDGLSFAGSASQVAPHVRLVHQAIPQGATYQTGAVWYDAQVLLTSGFTTTFEFRVSTSDPGADGLAFVIQSESPSALGGCGYGLGYLDADTYAGSCDFYGNPGKIPNALAVEIDMYENSAAIGPWPPEYISDGWLLGGDLVGTDHLAAVTTVLFFDDFETTDPSRWAKSINLSCQSAFDVRYADCGDGTVRDTLTNLLWLKDASCTDLVGTDSEGRATFDPAMDSVDLLFDGVCGLTDGSAPGDWHVATRDQWDIATAAAVNLGCTNANGPTVTNDAGDACIKDGPSSFSGVESARYWTSTDSGPSAFIEILWDGHTDLGSKTYNNYIWPVRWP